jgi:hypothetical protein
MIRRHGRSDVAWWIVPLVAGLVLVVSTTTLAQERTQQPGGTATRAAIQTHDDLQPAQLPPLPKGMTIQTIVQGDSVYHGKGNCSACHGVEGEGVPAPATR